MNNRRKSSTTSAVDVRSTTPPIINTPSEYSDYIKTAEMDVNDPSSISEMGPRSPLYTLESLHDIEELMGIEEVVFIYFLYTCLLFCIKLPALQTN